jgi:hypothetical protein
MLKNAFLKAQLGLSFTGLGLTGLRLEAGPCATLTVVV